MYRILVVEDEEDIQKILKNYLVDQGYAVTLANDGVDGIAKFHSGTFDLVLLDVMMPKIDGFGVCELIRRESNVPIIMLTALEEEAYQIKGYDMKADDYVTGHHVYRCNAENGEQTEIEFSGIIFRQEIAFLYSSVL